MLRGALKPETRVVLRMSDHHNEGTAALVEDLQAASDELRADALALAIRPYRHRCQAHPVYVLPVSLDYHGREQDMAHDLAVLSHQRHRVRTSPAQFIDQVSLRRLPERKLIDVSNRCGVFRPLWTNGNHVWSCRRALPTHARPSAAEDQVLQSSRYHTGRE